MKFVKASLLFILSFLFAVEVFLFFDIDAHVGIMIAVSTAFAVFMLYLKPQVIHWYCMNFEPGYKKGYLEKKKYKHRHRGHSGHRHSHHHHANDRQFVKVPTSASRS